MVVVGPLRARPVRPPPGGRGAWYWRAELHEDGHRRTVWTGRGSSAEVAVVLAGLVAEGRLTRRARDGVRLQTVSDLLRAWLHAQEGRADLAESTVRAYRVAVRRLAPWAEGVRLVSGPDEIPGSYLRDAQRAGRSTGTQRMDLMVLRASWAWAGRLGVVRGEIRPPVLRHVPARSTYTPSDAEIRRVIDWLRDNKPPVWAGIAWLTWMTGARLGEVARVRVDDVDAVRGVVRIGRGGKGARGRDVPVPEWAIPELARLVDVYGGAAGARLFRCRTVGTIGHELGPYVREACAALELPAWTPHALRRAADDRLFDAGVDVGTVAQLQGHSAVTALRHYRRATPGHRRNSVVRAWGLSEAGESGEEE